MAKNGNPPHEGAEYREGFWDQVCNDEYIEKYFEGDTSDSNTANFYQDEANRNPTISNLENFFDSNENQNDEIKTIKIP